MRLERPGHRVPPVREARPARPARQGRKDRRERAAKQDCPVPHEPKGLLAKKVRLARPGRRALAEKLDHQVLPDRRVSRASAPLT